MGRFIIAKTCQNRYRHSDCYHMGVSKIILSFTRCHACFGLRVLSSPASVSVCLCVPAPSFLRDNLSSVQARITKFRPEVLNILVKIPINLGLIDLDLQCRNQLKITIDPHFWARAQDKLPPIQVKISKFRTEIHLSTVTIPIHLGLVELYLQFIFYRTLRLIYFALLYRHYVWTSLALYLLRPSLAFRSHHTEPWVWGRGW